MIRRFGETVVSGLRYRYRPGAYAVLLDGDMALVTHQSHPYPEYQLPGGGIDPGESPVQALHREVKEETGWRISGLRKIGVFRRFVYMPEYDLNAEKICHIYAARPVYELSAPTEPGHRAVWMHRDEAALQLGTAGDRHFMSVVSGL